MREIKFRAWDKEEKEMIYHGNSIEISLEGNVYYSMDGLDEEPRYIIMQYTGLKDKNGKEIYEGDIVRDGIDGEVIWEGKGKIIKAPYGKVFYNTNGAYFDIEMIGVGIYEQEGEQIQNLHMNHYDGVYQWIERKNQSKLEVIGNIYENKELLDA